MTNDMQKESGKSKLKKTIRMLFRTGFSSIFITNILVKFVGLAGNILLVRLLGQNEYGSYAYIMNAYAVLCLLADFGTGMTSVQLCSEYHKDEEKRDALFSMAFRRSMLFTLLSCALLLGCGLFYPFNMEDAALYTALLFFLPLIENANRFLLNNAQIKLQNKIYARINLFSSLIRYFVLLPFSYLFSFRGALYSEYVIQLAVMCFAIISSRDFLRLRAPEKCLPLFLKKTFTRLSLSSALNNIINNSFSLIDIFLMGIIVKDMELLASYKAATTVPVALAIIPAAVDIYIMPHFARNRTNLKWVKKTYVIALGTLSAFNLLFCIPAMLLSSWIMTLLFGAEYQAAGICFAILLVGYCFSAVRMMTYTVLYTQRRVNLNVILTCITLSSNVVLNLLLIPRYQSVGAALASAASNLLAALLMVVCLIVHLWHAGKNPQDPTADIETESALAEA